MQSVHAMRPEARAEYAEVRARLAGDAAFLTRLERFFTELRDPLVALYGDDPRFPAQLTALLDAMAATARDRDPELRRLDHELIYMGDELGLPNDPGWAAEEHHRGDNRWMHRPRMDGAAAERRLVPGSVEAALWDGLRRLIAARRGTRATHAQGAGRPLWTGNDHVYGLLRTFAGERVLVLANFTADEQWLRGAILAEYGLSPIPAAAIPDGRPVRAAGESLILAPYQFAWVAGR